MRQLRNLVFTAAAILCCADASAALVGDNLSARVRGWTAGNWGVAVGDSVGGASFVSSSGDAPWVDTNTYSFALTYDSTTGLATFRVTGTGFDSGLLTTPDYGITGFGFTGINVGLVDAVRSGYPTTDLTLSNLMLNGSAVGPIGGINATTSYVTSSLYSGAVLGSINLTGNFVMTGDYSGNGERTKFDLYLTGATAMPAPVPVPAALWLLGSGLVGLVGLSRRRKV